MMLLQLSGTDYARIVSNQYPERNPGGWPGQGVLTRIGARPTAACGAFRQI